MRKRERKREKSLFLFHSRFLDDAIFLFKKKKTIDRATYDRGVPVNDRTQRQVVWLLFNPSSAFLAKLACHLVLKKGQALAILELHFLRGRERDAANAAISAMHDAPHAPIPLGAKLSPFWAAALLDAEACFALDPRTNMVTVRVAQKWRAVLDWLKRHFGGEVHPVYESRSQRDERWKKEKEEGERREREGLPPPAAAADPDPETLWSRDDEEIEDVETGEKVHRPKKRIAYEWVKHKGARPDFLFFFSFGLIGKGYQADVFEGFFRDDVKHGLAEAATTELRGNGGGTAKAADHPHDPEEVWGEEADAAAAAAAAAAEQPCTVRVRLWRTPWPLEGASLGGLVTPALSLGDVALCSEMGVHFSPCGRFLAACCPASSSSSPAAASPSRGGAEAAPQAPAAPAAASEGAPVAPGAAREEASSAPAPTPPPPPPPPFSHELRILSIRGPTFGRVLASAPVRAASALTCVQWSPGSESVLLAYGRRHPALAVATAEEMEARARARAEREEQERLLQEAEDGLFNLLRPPSDLPLPPPAVEEREGGQEGDAAATAPPPPPPPAAAAAVPQPPRPLPPPPQQPQQQQQQQSQQQQPRPHVVVEVVDARDPSLVVASVSSAEDEVNAAAFHPFAGGGIAYGTKEGRLRVLRPGWG